MFPIDQGVAFAEGSEMNLEPPTSACKGVMPPAACRVILLSMISALTGLASGGCY